MHRWRGPSSSGKRNPALSATILGFAGIQNDKLLCNKVPGFKRTRCQLSHEIFPHNGCSQTAPPWGSTDRPSSFFYHYRKLGKNGKTTRGWWGSSSSDSSLESKRQTTMAPIPQLSHFFCDWKQANTSRNHKIQIPGFNLESPQLQSDLITCK